MKHFLRIAALLALFAFPSGAQATAKFLVLCSTSCTWDNTNDAIWSTSSGGANNTTHPVAGDAVTVNASSCVGGTTCTITTGAVTIAASTITWGACTASTTGCIIDASANNTNFTLNSTGGTAAFDGTGSGSSKWLAGTGTYNLTSTGAAPHFDMSGKTNDTGSVFSGATWVTAGNTTNTGGGWAGGGFSFGATTFGANTSRGSFNLSGSNTFSSLVIGNPSYIVNAATTTTITGALTMTGTAALPIAMASNGADSTKTISLGAASTGAWVTFRAITTSGAAAFNSSTCIDQGRNFFANGGTCNPPVPGGGGGRIIGG